MLPAAYSVLGGRGSGSGVSVLGMYGVVSLEGGSGLVGLRMGVRVDGTTGFRMASSYTCG
jgi:hypothetical protein